MAALLATVRFYEVVLWVHITAVVVAFGTLFAYPLFLSLNARAPIGERASLHRLQIAFSKRITGPAIVVILAAGFYLASDAHLWSQSWVGAGLALLIVIAGLGATVLRKGEERLLACAESGDEGAYAKVLAPLLGWTALTLALIVVTIFLMAVKP
jgi:Predicted integral membrane protein (DUF2269)